MKQNGEVLWGRFVASRYSFSLLMNNVHCFYLYPEQYVDGRSHHRGPRAGGVCV